MERLNEESHAYLAVNFTDHNGDAIVPSWLRYRLDCLTSGVVLIAWEEVLLGLDSTMTFLLTSTHNAIQNQANDYELKLFTIEAYYGGEEDRGVREEFEYEVKNLHMVT